MRVTTVLCALAVASCGGQAGPKPCTPGEPGCPPAESEPEPSGGGMSTDERMWHHFWLVAEARNAVVAGDSGAVQPPMQMLAEGTYGEEIPYDWMEWVEEMQAEAKKAANAGTLREAADAVSAVASKCADCHRATRGGKDLEGHGETYEPHGRPGLHETMARHVWAADELWIGMTGPNHEAWVRGWKALTAARMTPMEEGAVGAEGEGEGEGAASAEGEAPASAGGAAQKPAEGEAEAAAGDEGAPAAGGDPVPEGMQAEIEAIRALGERAKTADLPKQKQAIYADLITRCGTCHASLGVKILE